MRRLSNAIRVILAVGILGVLVASPAVLGASPKRNIVVFVTDDQSPDMGVYGNPVVKTPNMDRLAEAGTRFTNAFCTTASCSASRSVILTGLFNHANGQYGHQHSYHKFSAFDNIVSLPLYLEHAGYRTARCGKYHVAPEVVFHFETVIPGSGRNDVQLAENCRRFLNEESGKPFFLYFATFDPHRSGQYADELPQRPNRFGNPPPGKSFAGVKEVRYSPEKVILPPFLPDTAAARAEVAQYYESISRIDQGLGRLIEILKAAGKWDDTLIVYLSDHGMAFPGAKTTLYEGGMRVPLLVRNPYAARRGVVNDAMISWVDLVPTILDFAGILDPATGTVKQEVLDRIPPNHLRKDPQNTGKIHPGSFHGRSFLPVLGQEHPKGWDEVYASHTFHEITMYYPMRVVHERRYKLIWNIADPLPFPFASDLWAAPTWQAQFKQGMDAPYGPWTVGSYIHRPKFQLFDLKTDPLEAKNLAGDPDYAELLERLKAKLKAFEKRTADPWILKWEYE